MPTTGHLVLEPFADPVVCPVIDRGSGSVLGRVPCGHLTDARPNDLVWYDDSHTLMLDGADLYLLDVSTGHRTPVMTLPEPARDVIVAAGKGITGPAANLLF